MSAVPVDLEAVRQRYADHMALWAGSVEAMHGPFTAAGAVTCAAAASAADVPDLRAEIERLRDLVENASREKFRQGVELRAEVERLRSFADRLILFDDPDPASDGFRARRAVTMTRIIDEARVARGEVR